MPDARPTDAETLEQLTGLAWGHTGRVPARRVAEHVLDVTQGGDWPLRRAAMDGLLRRVKLARSASEAWRVERRPRGKSPLGHYRVSVGKSRRYHLLLRSAEALDGRCDCPDFLKGSLRLCKHLWWLLEGCHTKAGAVPAGALPAEALRWEPVRPLTGPGDWLERVTWVGAGLPPRLAGFFTPGDKGHTLRRKPHEDSAARLELVRALRRQLGPEEPSDPALAARLAREALRLERQRAGATAAKGLRKGLRTLKRSLFPYQVEGVRRFVGAGHFLLADDMGLGKTAQAIAGCHALYALGEVKRGLLIVPAALKSQWRREWGLFTDAPLTVVDGTPEARRAQYRGLERGFLVVNYEQVLKDLPELLKLAPDLVVLDEAQRIKNWAAKTSMYVKALQPRWRLVLTGTPLENRLEELASLLEWVDEDALEPRWRLPEWHALRADGTREVVGVRNLDTLRARLAPSTLRRTRKEVLSQLPPRQDTHVPVSLTPEQHEAHQEFEQPIARLLSTAHRRPLTQAEFLRLMSLFTQQRIICNGLGQRDFEEAWPLLERGARPSEARLRGLFSPKLFELRELVGNLVLTQGRKVVVFSAWKRMLKLAHWAVSDLLGDAGLRAVFFTGDESAARRTQNVVDFHDDERARVFFATDAGGVGLNLQRAANACIHLDLPWNPAVLEQRSGRIYRLGQTEPVDIYSLVSVDGLEGHIATIIGSKKALFDGLFDGVTDEVRFERGGSMVAQLSQLLDADARARATAAAVEAAAEEAAEALGAEAVELDAEAGPGVTEATPAAAAPLPAAMTPPAPAAGFLSGLSMRRLDDGRMVLEAQPEAAAAFASMLEGVAALLRQLPAPVLAPQPVEGVSQARM